jgi:hypothetical protein
MVSFAAASANTAGLTTEKLKTVSSRIDEAYRTS